MKRKASEDEKSLFRKVVEQGELRPAVRAKAKKPTKAGLSGGLDGHTAERLKRGSQQPTAKLDLHGMTEDAAHKALKSFLGKAQKKGARLALVITGNGQILKAQVPRWLNQPGFAALVRGTSPAHIRHGGAGALYVYLKR